MQATPRPDSIKAYTKLGLRVYDRLIVEWLAPEVWGCDPDVLVDYYRQHVTSNHADIGVGTGYFLDRCGLDPPNVRLALIDLHPNCLEHASTRLARYRPQTYLRNALCPIEDIAGPPFDSVALGGILHCLAGEFPEKGKVFDHIASLTRAGTKIFGYSLVSDDVSTRASRRVAHRLLNQLRVVANANDRLDDLHTELAIRFVDCSVEVVGCMGLFSAVVATP